MYRAYDPNVGRWISRDPLEESAGANVRLDPSGIVGFEVVEIENGRGQAFDVLVAASCGWIFLTNGDHALVPSFSSRKRWA